ncbi:MAG: hypothetical protein ACR2QA_09535 [Solirubrobacteraceae bacterium]
MERERSLGPFDLDSLGCSAVLAAADLLAGERHAHLQEPPGEHASAETVLATPLAKHAADAAASLIALTRALAYAAGDPATASRQAGSTATRDDQPRPRHPERRAGHRPAWLPGRH